MTKKPHQIYQIKITLKETQPPIWRRILVRDDTTLLKLHDILQIVMGWEDYHLHMFKIKEVIYGDPEDDEYGDLDTVNEAYNKLDKVIEGEGQRFDYEYDFGDGWAHTLLVEKILEPQEGVRYPLCLQGKRACPPEDVGGVWGYELFLEAIRNPKHDEHQDYLNWVGGKFNPEDFDLEEINAQLRKMGRGRSTKAQDAWSIRDYGPWKKKFNLDTSWTLTLSKEEQLAAEELPLRRDVVTLLTYLSENKITGTKSTGNLSLKAVYEICSRFVDPPKLDETAGERVFRVRSETEVWPLYFRHLLAAFGGLVLGGVGRRWKVTPSGESFLKESATVQIWLLLATWWTQINWAIASPYYYGDGYMPPGFSRLALKRLLERLVDESTPFEAFADRIIEDARMVWPNRDQEEAQRILQYIIERTLIYPLADFGILQIECRPGKTLGMRYPELYAFQITPFGKSLLEAVNNATES